MGQYSIRELESLSGIKAHTLRIWEQRYDFLTPHRTDTNIRYYTDEQLKKVLNIALLNKNGYKISRITEMNAEEIKDTVLKITDSNQADTVMDSLIHAMIDFDEARFDKTLNAAIMRLGFANAFTDLLLPFLQRTGILWSTGVVKPVQEHFMSNLIKRKLHVAIDNQFVTKGPQSRKFILFLREGEWHDLMLLFTDFILRSHNHETVYLGCSVPFDDLHFARTAFQPDYLVSFLTAPMQHESVSQYLQHLTAALPGQKIFIGGPQLSIENASIPANAKVINSAESLLSNLREDSAKLS